MNRFLQIIAPMAMAMVAIGVMLAPIGFTSSPDTGGEVTRLLVEWRWFLAVEGVVGLALLAALKCSTRP